MSNNGHRRIQEHESTIGNELNVRSWNITGIVLKIATIVEVAAPRPRLADLLYILTNHGGSSMDIGTPFLVSFPWPPSFSHPLLHLTSNTYINAPYGLCELKAELTRSGAYTRKKHDVASSTCPSEYDAYLRKPHRLISTTIKTSPPPRRPHALFATAAGVIFTVAVAVVDHHPPPRWLHVPIVRRHLPPADDPRAVGTVARVDALALDGPHLALDAVSKGAAARHPRAEAGLELAREGVPEEGHAAPDAEVAWFPLPTAHGASVSLSLCLEVGWLGLAWGCTYRNVMVLDGFAWFLCNVSSGSGVGGYRGSQSLLPGLT